MSAYLCDTKMFARLARFATPEPRCGVMPYMLEARGCASLAGRIAAADGNVALAYARLLQAANVASVAARYGADAANVELIGADDVEVVRAAELPAVAILKACDCLEYQSSETDDWYTSDAKILVDAIRENAIDELPGYAEAHWGYPLMPREVQP